MHVLITGAAGMLGRKLAAQLVRDGCIGRREIGTLTLVDVDHSTGPAESPGGPVRKTADLSVPGTARDLVAAAPEVIFHLAAVVSGEAETDFGKGYRVNLDGTRQLFDAIHERAAGQRYRPRVVFASSVAVFGAPLPDVIGDDFFTTPLTSYGTQKAICELLLTDYSRRGILDGIALRLPTICVRPGAPNRAASGFFSSIVREPLAGLEAVLPVGDEVRHWFASPRAAVGFLTHAAAIDLAPLGGRRSLSLPGLCASVGEELAALRRIGGDGALRRIRREPNAAIARIVEGWPRAFDPQRALALGFRAERSFDEIIAVHVEDELAGIVAAG
jgi:nucleoside-diphosphate-sugar epimerase